MSQNKKSTQSVSFFSSSIDLEKGGTKITGSLTKWFRNWLRHLLFSSLPFFLWSSSCMYFPLLPSSSSHTSSTYFSIWQIDHLSIALHCSSLLNLISSLVFLFDSPFSSSYSHIITHIFLEYEHIYT